MLMKTKRQLWGYRENEPMGGYDPYSSSKGAAEIAIVLGGVLSLIQSNMKNMVKV